MAPDPATSKSRGSRHRACDIQPNGSGKAGDSTERGSQRTETTKRKSHKDGRGTELGRGVKRRQYGSSGGDGDWGGTSGSASSTHRPSKRWRGGGVFEILHNPITTDRWDGGSPDSVKDNALSSARAKEESKFKSGEGNSVKGMDVRVVKEGGDVEKAVQKHKPLKVDLRSDNRAITVMDLQEADFSDIDSNIKIKNKVSYRRESSFDFTEPEFEQGVRETATLELFRLKKLWDREVRRGRPEDMTDDQFRVSAAGEGSQEWAREKESASRRDGLRDEDLDDEDKVNGKSLLDGIRDIATEVNGGNDVLGDLDHKDDFKIQEELRNIELEKELENRIRRRREESSDRDRWRDDDREREGKLHSDFRDEHGREERHRLRRERERHSDGYEREYRQRREGSKLSDERPRDDSYYANDLGYKIRREEKYDSGRLGDTEDQVRGARSRDRDLEKDRKGRENLFVSKGDRRARDKGFKEDGSEWERSHLTTRHIDSPDGARSEHRHKRAREGDGDGYGTEEDHSRRNREERDMKGRHERTRDSPRDSDVIRGRALGNSSWRNDSEIQGEDLSSPRHDARRSASFNRLDYGSSPQPDGQRSPRYRCQGSPSSHIDGSSGPRRRAGVVDLPENSNSVATSSGPQRRSQGRYAHTADRGGRSRWHIGAEEEVKSFRPSRSFDEGRVGSLSPHRMYDQHHCSAPGKFALHYQDNFPRGTGRAIMDARGGAWRAALQAGSAPYDGGPLDHHGPDDSLPRDRSDRMRRASMNRPPGSPLLRSQGAQLSSLTASPLPLPPPPPLRPGIDNPAVLNAMNGGFDDTSGSRDQGRSDRKGGPLRRGDPGGGIGPGEGWKGVNMGSWNSRNQGPIPGPFPPQFRHPSAGGGVFPVMGQQFLGLSIFPGGGGRPPLDMAFGAARFLGPGNHMVEAGDGYLGPGRGGGWHGEDDGRGPPLLGPGDGWEGPVPHAEDRLRPGRMEWERGPMEIGGWERDLERDIWEGRGRDGAGDFMLHQSLMEPPPQNLGFHPPGSAWNIARESQIPNDLKPRQDKQSLGHQEMKMKSDGGIAKTNATKPNGRGDSSNDGKLIKFVTVAMHSILSQLDISADLAGPELYAQYCALLPSSDSEKLSISFEGMEYAFSEPADDDLTMEVDSEADGLIPGTNVLAKLLPLLPDAVFEEALRLYRAPETENRVQKSSRGSFVLPFASSTLQIPAISLKVNPILRETSGRQSPTGVGVSMEQLDINAISTGFRQEIYGTDERVKSDGRQVDLKVEAAEGGAKHEFIHLHVEVAEYSDREFEAEMEDTLEDGILKEVHGSGPLSEALEYFGEGEDLSYNLAVDKKSVDPIDILVDHSTISLVKVDDSLVDQVVPEDDDGVVDAEDQVGKKNIKADSADHVNSFVVLKDPVENDDSAKETQNIGEIEGEGWVFLETGATEVTIISEILLGQHMDSEAQDVNFPQIKEKPSSEASMLTEVNEAAGGNFMGSMKEKVGFEVKEIIAGERSAGERDETLTDLEGGGSADPGNVHERGQYLQQGASNSLTAEGGKSRQPEEGPKPPFLENDASMEISRQQQATAENLQARERLCLEEPPQEPLARLRTRRTSSRLQAQALEAQVAGRQDASGSLVNPESGGTKSVGTRGKIRATRRRTKRRGSRH